MREAALPLNALTIDVEDMPACLLLRACGRVAPPTESVVPLTERLLSLAEEYGHRATCFVLGEVAERYPGLVRRIHSGGHELGVHGWHHHRVFDLERGVYRESLRRAKSLLEDISGAPVAGYRAVEFSIRKDTLYAYEVLAELGFRYSSSVFPIRGRRYGIPSADLVPYRVTVPGGSLMEVPMTAVNLGPLRLPALGGGYLRHFPLLYSKVALWLLGREGRPAVMYLHPHEVGSALKVERFPIDLREGEAEKIASLGWSYFRNVHRTEGKLRWMFSRHRFGRIDEVHPVRIPPPPGGGEGQSDRGG